MPKGFSRRYILRLAGSAVALPAVSHLANAQDYPDKPVRIITHSAAGGSPDALLRIVGDRLSQMWGRQVVVLNQPGAGGAIAARAAAQAAPDGYTLYMPASSAFVTLPGLQANLPLEVPRDFIPIGFVALQPFYLSVTSSLDAKTLPEFIALAKRKPGELSYAATGRGTLSHLTGEGLQQRAGIKLLMVLIWAGPRRRSMTSSPAASRWSSMPCRRLRARCKAAAFGRSLSAPQATARLSRPADDRRDASRLQPRRLACAGRAGRHT